MKFSKLEPLTLQKTGQVHNLWKDMLSQEEKSYLNSIDRGLLKNTISPNCLSKLAISDHQTIETKTYETFSKEYGVHILDRARLFQSEPTSPDFFRWKRFHNCPWANSSIALSHNPTPTKELSKKLLKDSKIKHQKYKSQQLSCERLSALKKAEEIEFHRRIELEKEKSKSLNRNCSLPRLYAKKPF
ncbi:unnamed protein product [Blepharisma stoltei]|uniref:Uncharacterized protein n=1 Tax=Blepharisma stoltei TaxID=1481888 RepID=A0AAU9IYV3_9CILI|nr:unnamed protein product [Blepharisma stoltei]